MNLYDCCLAPDVLNMRIVSMRYEHWDTHEDNLQDLFGAADSGALATLKEELALLPYQASPAQDNLVCCFTTGFGRQLAANGDNGTDHGRSGYSIPIGKDVTGGVYGEMFPQREITPDAGGLTPYQTPGADIAGLTSVERILSAACDWMQAGAGAPVFPNAMASPLEAGVDLSGLFNS